MKPEHDPLRDDVHLESAFHSLKSQRAALSENFSRSLENQLMNAKVSRNPRRTAWLAAVIGGVLLMLVGGTGYAVTHGFKSWPWTIHIDENGTVTDTDGQVIGGTTVDEDGTVTTTIQMGQGSIIMQPISKIQMGPDGKLEETPLTPNDLKNKSITIEVEN